MKAEILELRQAMEHNHIDYYLVPTNDYHGSEFINDHFKCREYLTGFTGSAGTLLVGQKEALLWTDGRYFLQAENQLKDTGVQLMKMDQEGVPSLFQYLEEHLTSGMKLGFDGKVVTFGVGDALDEIAKKNGASIMYDVDLAGYIWIGRPPLKGKPVVTYPLSYAGDSTEEKLEKIRYVMEEKSFDYHIITGLTENAWLYNLRGSDVVHTPVFFSFTLITPKETRLYCFESQFEDISLPVEVTVRNYDEIWEDIKTLPEGTSLLASLSDASYTMIKSVPDSVHIINGMSPATSLKAVKNTVEISSTKHAHIDDAIAMVNFMYWLDTVIGSEEITEFSAAKKLENFRRSNATYRDLSFDTISAYGPNGAIVHYTPERYSSALLKDEGFLLLDSGGQYLNGTTDITRTIVLGPLTDKMKECYTAVLKANLKLSMATFKMGTNGKTLDAIARNEVKEAGYDYNHGTGHGVGHYLSVHEGPNSISPVRGFYPIYPGMITTDEPGIYIEGEFGVRLENELLCIKSNSGELSFSPITLVPFDRRAIIKENLDKDIIDYLNSYHSRVYNTLRSKLEPEVDKWLREMTAPL